MIGIKHALTFAAAVIFAVHGLSETIGPWNVTELKQVPDWRVTDLAPADALAYTEWPRHIAPEDQVLFKKYVLYDLDNDIGNFDKRGKIARPLGEETSLTPNELIP